MVENLPDIPEVGYQCAFSEGHMTRTTAAHRLVDVNVVQCDTPNAALIPAIPSDMGKALIGSLMFSVTCAWWNGWVSNHEAGDLRHHRTHYYVTVMKMSFVTLHHYDDVIMNAIASQITSLMIVYSIVYSDADQSKHQSSASLAFVWGIHRDRWIPRTKGQLRGKCFHLMTSSWHCRW